jgi:hypothetical protein
VGRNSSLLKQLINPPKARFAIGDKHKEVQVMKNHLHHVGSPWVAVALLLVCAVEMGRAQSDYGFYTTGLGIGTGGSPLLPLHIRKDQVLSSPYNGQLLIEPLSNNQESFIHLKTTTTLLDRVWGIGTGTVSPANTNFRIHDFTDNVTRFVIDRFGNVSIGTNTGTNLAKFNVHSSAGILISANGATGQVFQVANDGTTSTKVLQITGGADLAEPFEFSDAELLPPGSVVVIDDENPGRMKLSNDAYDKRVAGVISGAGGINPGVTLHQKGVSDRGQNVALSGRVYVFASTSNGAIAPGDLLTTSDVPGHAMKATDPTLSHGTVIGKAMSRLESGEGLVLVLVNLQ